MLLIRSIIENNTKSSGSNYYVFNSNQSKWITIQARERELMNSIKLSYLKLNRVDSYIYLSY